MERAYEFAEAEFLPGENRSVLLKRSFVQPIPKTGIPGYPETAMVQERAVEVPFLPKWIDIEKDGWEKFRVHFCLVGCRYQWGTGNLDGVAPYIFAEKPDISFDIVEPGIDVCLSVTNFSKERATFRARLVGEDVKQRAKKSATLTSLKGKRKSNNSK